MDQTSRRVISIVMIIDTNCDNTHDVHEALSLHIFSATRTFTRGRSAPNAPITKSMSSGRTANTRAPKSSSLTKLRRTSRC